MATREEIEGWINSWNGKQNRWRDKIYSKERSARQILSELKNLERHYPKESQRPCTWIEIMDILDQYERREL